MAKTSKKKVKEVLTSRLGLKDPEFKLELLSNRKVSGSVISDTFDGMDDRKRQRVIWDALDAEFASAAPRVVGVLFAYTRAEWDMDLADTN